MRPARNTEATRWMSHSLSAHVNMKPDTSEQSREMFQLVVENVEDFAVYAKDLGGRILSWNPGVERLLGYEEEEWVGQHVSIIFTPEDRERQAPEREMETALRLGRAEDRWWLVRKDGSLFWANGLLMLLRDERGEPRGFAKILRNETGRKRAEEALRDSERVLDHLIRNIPGGSISVFDRDLRYLFAGGQGLTQVGLSPERLVGKSLTELFPRDAVEYVTPYYRRAFAGEALDFELEVGGRWFIISAAPLDDAQGRINAVIALAQDITGRKQAEDELRRAHDELERRVEERTAALRQMAGELLEEVKERRLAESRIKELLRRVTNAQELERLRIARDLHDNLGQQLTWLRLNLDLLKASCGTQAEACERIEKAQEIAESIEREVDFIAWELRPAALDQLGLAQALDDFTQEFSKHYRVAAEFHSTGMKEVRLAPDVETNLYRIAQEALNNVMKHAGANRVGVLLERVDGNVSLIVEDDGVGFEPGMAVDGERGMGLLSMRERAAQIGGTLEIESEPGAGTTLYVRVPAGDADTRDEEN